MAIERIWQSGMETGDILEFDSTAGSPTAATASKKTGTYSVYINALIEYGLVNVTPTRQSSVGLFIYYSTVSQNTRLLSLRNSSTELVHLQFVAATIGINLYVGGTLRDSISGTGINADWKHLGIDAKIDSSSGWVKVYLDGKEILSYTGNTGNANINNILFGNNSTQAGAYYLDDMYIDDITGESSPTAPHIKRFFSLTPNADGNYSQWVGSATGTSHYQLVDERPPDSDTTYVEAVTGSLIDSYGVTTFTLDTNEDIIAMIPFAVAKRTNSTEQMALGTRSSGTDSVGSDQDLTLSYNTGYVWERQVTGSLGASWNQSYMDSVEVVIKSAGTY